MPLTNTISLPDLLTIKQAGKIFHLCRQTIYKYIHDGTIPAFKNPAGKYMIPRKYLDDMVTGCYNTGATNCDCPAEGGIEYVG